MHKVNNDPSTPVEIVATGGKVQMLQTERLFSNDPLFTFLHGKFGDALTVTINVLLAGIVFFGGAALNEGFFNKTYDDSMDSSTALLLDVSTSLRKILLILLGLSAYFLFPRWVASLFNDLERNRVIGTSRTGEATYQHFLSRMVKTIDRKVWSAFGIATVIAFWLYRIIPFDGDERPLWLEVAALIVYALVFYTFLPTLIKLCIVLFYTNRLFSLFHIKVNPLHPDTAGGLGPVRRMLTRFVIIFVAFGLLAATGMVSAYYRGTSVFSRAETAMLIVGYISFPLLLWGWLLAPHKAMTEARDRKLLGLAEEFLRAIPDKDVAFTVETPLIKESTERLSEIKKQYELVRETHPTWPIRFRQVNKLIALASTPLITTLLPVVIQYLTGVITSRLKP